jgi:hypothetical protein
MAAERGGRIAIIILSEAKRCQGGLVKAKISIQHDEPDAYTVKVVDGSSATQHIVTMTAADAEHYASGARPERLLEAAFVFLLEREPKESILRRFSLPDIERYFPDFPKHIARYLAHPNTE